jgi:hypothetical protein
MMSRKGIEPLTAINQFFYREPPLPIGSPALNFNGFYNLILFLSHPALLFFIFNLKRMRLPGLPASQLVSRLYFYILILIIHYLKKKKYFKINLR